MMVDWDLVVVFIMVATFLVGLYFYARNIEPGCSGNCQQGRRPCDCNLNKKDQA
jgi:hypothetical protein